MTFRERLLQGPPLLGDGANGTVLWERGVEVRPPDLAVLSHPDAVREVHAAYFAAGSDFVETNTFGANRFRLGDDFDVVGLNRAAARLAREACPPDRYVLGAIGPSGRRVAPIGSLVVEEFQAEIACQARALVEGGVDGFFLETFDDVAELRAAVEAVRSVSDLPLLASKSYVEDGGMLAEGLPIRIAEELDALDLDALGANCIVGPQRMLELVRMIARSTDKPVVAFPTPGLPQLVKGRVVYDKRPEYFAQAVGKLVAAGARVVGGCCGTTPEHIAAIRTELNRLGARPAAARGVKKKADPKAPLPEVEPSGLLAALRLGRFVTTVELDVPRGLRLDKFLQEARDLKEAGADVVNVSDGARARLRMNPAAVSHLVQRDAGIETTMHFACRDRNLLAIQADLLAAHALGVRNVLAVTGDPANIGDYPSATSVFDIDAVGLVRVLALFNEGRDLAGYDLGVRGGFTVACAYNPLAPDQPEEEDRLRRKADAGAHVIYTQPVFDRAQADACVTAARAVGLPVLVGLLPLRNARQADFMANEVPGIEVPERLLKLMHDAPDDASALEIGMGEAHDLADHVRASAQGLYLMPPAARPDLAARLMRR